MKAEVRTNIQNSKIRLPCRLLPNSLFLYPTFQPGFVAISTVLVVSAVVLVVGTSVTLLAIGEAQASLAVSKSEANLQLTEGCMEDALLLARARQSYTGSTINRPEGSCTVSVAKNGSQWTLTAVPNTLAYKRTIQVVVNNTSSLSVISWQECIAGITPC